MIDYDYLIERDEGNERTQYKPDKIPTHLPNLVRIEGPNSSGKSTLLNFIAIGLHGHNLDKMNSSLKAKMKSLLESPHQNVTFDIKISGRDGGLMISSRKDSLRSPEIVIKEYSNGRPTIIIPEMFHKKYHLIYDIPDDPTGRLNQLILEIKDFQRLYGMRIGALRAHLLQTLEQIKSSRDPDRIKELRKNVTGQEKLYGSRKDAHESQKCLLAELETYTHARIFSDKLSQKLAAAERLKDFESHAKETEKKTQKRDEKYTKKREDVRAVIDDIRAMHRQIASTMRSVIPKDEKQHLAVWESISFDYVLRDCEFNPSFRREIIAIRSIMDGLLTGDATQKMLETKVFSDLVDFLKRYGAPSVVLPGLDKSIGDFIAILEEKNLEYKAYKHILDAVQEILSKLSEIEEMRREVELALVELRGLRGQFKNDDEAHGEADHYKIQLTELKAVLSDISEACSFYAAECAKKGITEANVHKKTQELERSDSIRPFLKQSDKQLEGAVDSLRETVMREGKAVTSLKASLDFNKIDLERLEKREPHKYQDSQELLNDLHRKCQLLEGRLTRQYETYITSVSGKSGAVSKSDDESRYFNAVSKFLGKKVGHIRHLEKQHKVVRVDLLSKTILTEEGKVIHFSDMGTGQGQAAYLLGLLNATDNRKIIALFDEVAMMDTKSMQPVIDKLKELHQKDKLLVGVVVQRSDSINVVPMV